MLNKLEHLILSEMMNDIEPLHIIYKYVSKDIPDTNINKLLKSLIKLVEMGLVEVQYYDGNYKPVTNLNLQQLEQHCEGRSEEELREYPSVDMREYFFLPTDEGRKKEAKDIYDIYYPSNS